MDHAIQACVLQGSTVSCSLFCMCIVCDSIHQELKLFSQVKLKEHCVRRQGGDGDGGKEERKVNAGKEKRSLLPVSRALEVLGLAQRPLGLL